MLFRSNTVTYASQLRTAEARSEAAGKVEQIYIIDDSITENLLQQVSDDFQAIEDARKNLAQDLETIVGRLREQLPGTYNDELLEYAVESASFAEIIGWRQNLRTAVSTVYQSGVREEDRRLAAEDVSAIIMTSSLTDIGKQFLEYYLRGTVLPANEIYDAQATG